MTNILAVANKMIEVSDFTISNLKLQKLLYYVYGINLVLNPDEEISEAPQAWDYGPVFPKVYRAFRRYGVDSIPIPASISPFNSNGRIEVPEDSSLYEIIRSVYEQFGHMSEFALVRLTHQPGTPWDKYYSQGKHNITMRKPTLKAYFREHVLASR